VRRLEKSVERLAVEIEIMKAAQRLERENLILQIDNTLLQFERRLPPA
jgi:hypothetical protein